MYEVSFSNPYFPNPSWYLAEFVQILSSESLHYAGKGVPSSNCLTMSPVVLTGSLLLPTEWSPGVETKLLADSVERLNVTLKPRAQHENHAIPLAGSYNQRVTS